MSLSIPLISFDLKILSYIFAKNIVNTAVRGMASYVRSFINQLYFDVEVFRKFGGINTLPTTVTNEGEPVSVELNNMILLLVRSVGLIRFVIRSLFYHITTTTLPSSLLSISLDDLSWIHYLSLILQDYNLSNSMMITLQEKVIRDILDAFNINDNMKIMHEKYGNNLNNIKKLKGNLEEAEKNDTITRVIICTNVSKGNQVYIENLHYVMKKLRSLYGKRKMKFESHNIPLRMKEYINKIFEIPKDHLCHSIIKLFMI
ncbi:hypothetical protein H8356DRAFT_1333660 [Neocallimastix lanati (nom. inval.)]|nr:hypothetical protein H8356DRAFT_1333660 [Neocallimastix sp. JGI-2020a]